MRKHCRIGLCVSLMLAPKYYEQEEGDSDPDKFVKKMGDSMALNEADIDLGTGRWTTSTDLIMDMLSALERVHRHAGGRDGQ